MKTDTAIAPSLTTTQFADKMKSIKSVLPDSLINELDALGSFTNQIRWRLGDAVNKTYDVLLKTGKGDLMDACWFVSIATHEFRTQNTLRGYASTASFYPQAIRKTYCHDELPFSHFAFAKSLKGTIVAGRKTKITNVPAWEVCLQYSLNFYRHHGYCTTEARLREMFKDYIDNVTVSVPVQTPITGDEFLPYPIQAEIKVDGDTEMVFEGFIQTVGNLFGLLPLMSKFWSADKSERVRNLLDELKKELED